MSIVVSVAVSRLEAAATRIAIEADAAPRVVYGADRLAEALRAAGLEASVVRSDFQQLPDAQIFVTETGHAAVRALVASGGVKLPGQALSPQGFALTPTKAGGIAIIGADDSGSLYGCIELARRMRGAKQLPTGIDLVDAPALTLRGACIGMQKTYILPGRHVYEYPYTPELFPFFYDKKFWADYLDFLAENRMNTLYLWSGHPFASLVKLPDYPYALEVSEAEFQRNVEMYQFITREADRRGIWIVQMFYNIILSKPFAEHNGLKTQLAAPTPIAADYTRKSIAEFVTRFPNVGLLVTLGEALQGMDNQVDWFTKVILPGVKDGMKAAGLTAEPPVVLRAHATDATIVMPAALKVYKNLYTMAKFNGESLTTWEPRGTRQELQLQLSKMASTHVVNVHILANLEPFRYGATSFIQKSVQAMRDRLGARGLHLYPLSFWNWPDAPDKTETPLVQYKRDWIWFEAWAHYAWSPDIDPATDRAYWIGRLSEMYGSAAAAPILSAYNDSGECAPRILRRFGITEGNRQTMSLGMTLDELVNPAKYKAFEELWESQSPPGERLQEYAEREWQHQPHVGETPPQIIREVLDFSEKAVAEIEAAESGVTQNRAEFERLVNDIYCIRAMSQNYAAKANAAMLVLRYGHSHEIADMEEAARYMHSSLDYYRTLTRLTVPTYLYANSMQTSQRRIPVSGGANGNPANYHWAQLLPLYEKEAADFDRRLAGLKRGDSGKPVDAVAFTPVPFTVASPGTESFAVKPGAQVFTDQPVALQSVVPQLAGLTGIRSAAADAKGQVPPIEFETAVPVQVLVGYITSSDASWRRAPDLENDALAAESNAAEPVLLNAATVGDSLPVAVYAYKYEPGRHKIILRGVGNFLVLGIVADAPKTAPSTP